VRIGVTGHQSRPGLHWEWVRAVLDAELATMPLPFEGISCLAAGADQEFARAVLRHGGDLHAVVPHAEYDASFEHPADHAAYRDLLAAAARVTELHGGPTPEDAYLSAGTYVVDVAEQLVAVWDGRPSRGRGGTADVVAYARGRIPILAIDPIAETVERF
jgi:hypothetical protein